MNDFQITSRWYPLLKHQTQQNLMRKTPRFFIVPSGRRSGKTEVIKRIIAREAIVRATDYDINYYFLGAPTRPQAKRIYWHDLKQMTKPFWWREPMESDLIVYTNFKGVISETHVLGMDRPSRIEGPPWNGGGLDEYGSMKRETWSEHVRPALSDRGGWCGFIGVPEGRNHYYNLTLNSVGGIPEAIPGTGVTLLSEDPEWGYFHWWSEDILKHIKPGEIESAKRDLDERTYRQEYCGEFLSYEGMLYYTFNERKHIRDDICTWTRYDPLYLTCDFNKSPMVWLVAQIFKQKIDTEFKNCIKYINELSIGYDAKTIMLAQTFCDRYREQKNRVVYVTGDASGNIESTKDRTTDYVIIRSVLEQNGFEVIFWVPNLNPNVNNRVNVGCSLFRSVQGHIRCWIHSDCKYLKDDLLLNESDGHGGKDKEDPQRTHGSDAFDYLNWRVFNKEYYGMQMAQL